MPKPGFKTITVPDWIIEEIKRQPDYKGNQAATLGQMVREAVASRSGELEDPQILQSRILNHLPHWDRQKSWELVLTILRWLQESDPTSE
ncbi:hypothetical protein [Nostoc sp. MG11]|uniref:hypothetical protein n=1 Tax=Nostoc sp. MG11 TaxID=2721166 RepID=UPI001868F49D|nr:hypothetical protein [Nostoc sp. MG11]